MASTCSLPLVPLLLFSLFSQVTYCQSTYTLKGLITPQSFFDHFESWTASDPSDGFVQFLNQSYAQEQALVSVFPDRIRFGVDSKNYYNARGDGRASVRFEGKDQFTRGLLILDAVHMPVGCGTWPAFWTYGPNWPDSGEIDVIEGANKATSNLMSLHTSSGCSVARSNQTGTLLTNDCDAKANSNSGCAVESGAPQSFGAEFNDIGGGVFAMEWTSSAIRVWFFPRDAIPDSVSSRSPDPELFGTPSANFKGSCDIDSHFANHRLVFDTTFCGAYAGSTYEASGCPLYDGLSGYDSCKKYVAENPSAFKNAYWEIRSLQVFQTASILSNATSSSITQLPSVLPAASETSLSSIAPALVKNTSTSRISSSTASSLTSIALTTAVNQTSRSGVTARPQFQSRTALALPTGNATMSSNATSSWVFPTLSPIHSSPLAGPSQSGLQGTGLPVGLPGLGINASTTLFGFAPIKTTMVYITETVTACPGISQTCRIPQMQRRELS